MDLIAIRDELADALETTTLPVFKLPQGSITPPCLLFGAPRVEYDASFQGATIAGLIDWSVTVTVGRQNADELSKLAAILGDQDDRSISVALRDTSPMSASWWRLARAEEWTDLDIGNVSYWACEVTIEIGVIV